MMSGKDSVGGRILLQMVIVQQAVAQLGGE